MPLQEVDAKEIVSRLDMMVKLLAAMYARDLKNNDAVVKLDKMRLSRENIAEAVGISTHNVAQVLYAKKLDKKATKGETPEPGGNPEETPIAEVKQ